MHVENYNLYDHILNQWGIKLRKTRPDITIQGSPERTSFRMVIEDDHEDLFIIE